MSTQDCFITPDAAPWRPPPGLPEHSGRPLADNLDFFAAPPAELGPVLSASSDARTGTFVFPVWLRLAVHFAATAAMLLVVDHFVDAHSRAAADNDEGRLFLRTLMGTIVALGGLAAAALLKWPRTTRRCSYVCRDGVAVYTLRSGRRVSTKAVMPFSAAAGLFVFQLDIDRGYGGSKFSSTFRDAAGRTLLRWSGGHTESGRAPRPHSDHALATAAEAAWTQHRLRLAAAELASGGAVEFPVPGLATLRVAAGVLEIVRPGGIERLTPADVKSIGVQNGHFFVRTSAATLFGSAGKFDAPYARLPNARVLLTLIDAVFYPAETSPAAARPAA